MADFKRQRGKVVAQLEPVEVELLADLLDQVRQMLAGRKDEAPADPLDAITGIQTAPSTAPADPVLARLLPDFHRDDETLAGGMRVLYEPGLLTQKDSAAVALLDSLPLGGGVVRLSEELAHSWTSAINDIRLALGVRLEISEDDGMPKLDRPELDGAGEVMYNVYQWLTSVQGALVVALMD